MPPDNQETRSDVFTFPYCPVGLEPQSGRTRVGERAGANAVLCPIRRQFLQR